MGNKKSKVTGISGDVVKVEQTSVLSKATAPRERINVQMVQSVHLIWLDSNIDENSADCRNTITELRRAMNTINTFTDGEECIQFLENMVNDKACMIISASLGQHIVRRVHNMSEVDSIFIFCGNKIYHEQWVREWPKIKGLFTEITPICEALKQAAQQCEQNAISMSFMATDDGSSKQKLNQLDPSFMYTQILTEILLTIEFDDKHIQEFTEYCCAALTENQGELKNVTKLQQKYRNEAPIWWYTYHCFLYPMLNRALRLMDVGLIIKMGFFISDLHRQIEDLHRDQFNGNKSGESFTVYRGQGMEEDAFKKMTKTIGGLLSFNCFLSTSKNRDVSLEFTNKAATNPDLLGILFVIVVDPAKSTTPFASIANVSFYNREDEVLFSMHTVFRIGEITRIDENNRLFQVNLTLTSDDDSDLCKLTDRIREETFPKSKGWYRLGQLLLQMGEYDKAKQVYDILLGQVENERASIYNQLGRTKGNQGEYKEAISFYEKSMEIYEQNLASTHSDSAWPYNNIGLVYKNMTEYSKALSYYEKALAIQQQSLSKNHPDLAKSYNNVGEVHRNLNEYEKALSYYEKAFEIQQQSLPANHPDLAKSYNNIGAVHYNMSDYSKALSSYEKALEIQQQSLPANHPDLANSYNNIGAVYNSMQDYSKAYSFYERAVDVGQQSLPSNHPRLETYRRNLDSVKKIL